MKTPQPGPGTIDAYISGHPPEIQRLLEQVRATILRAAPEATEAIKYGIPTFVLGENLVHFAGCRKHLGFYPTPSAIQKFARELSGYAGARGSVQFPYSEPIPLQLIEAIVRFRVAEIAARSKARPRRTPAARGRTTGA